MSVFSLVYRSTLASALALVMGFVTGSANGDLVIYESFSQDTGDLNGMAASSIGLSGNWSRNQTVNVVAPPPFLTVTCPIPAAYIPMTKFALVRVSHR